jgi:tyrosyl-tRNA synthetase
MLMGLDGSSKMSKSNPDNAIFMDDKKEDIKRKINKAFCEEGNVDVNPLLDWIEYLIFPILGKFVLPRNEKWNEPEIIFEDFIILKKQFQEKIVHPSRLKVGMINHINDLLKL